MPAQPTGPGEVHRQVEVLAADQQELAAPADLGDPLAGQGTERRLRRLQHGERGEVDALDHPARGVITQ
ncbi:hypothetical protein SDC9_136743 [bioreactor metagenome]|uniref:Uncharacterized protein n=1 Tax=bioreactor metagenome TaxID=1076179 RepID=A0A645DK55_9ZZZZ